jgi:putative ABC transport system permease protein
MLVLLLTGSSANFLDKQAKELEGGDVVLESTSMIPGEKIFSEAGIAPSAVSEKIEFSGTLQGAAGTAPFTIEVIDNLYPLYGELVLKNGVFGGVNEGELLLDEAGLKKLDVKVGDSVSFGDVSLLVSGVIRREPTSLFGDFRFFPKAFMSKDSFTKANVDLQLLRADYTYAARIPEISKSETESLLSLQETYPGVRISIAGKDQRGLQFGLSTVSNFLVIAVLITAVLAAVNVYASILYLITTERKSLAVLLSLGLTKRKLIYVLGAALGYVVVSAIFIGTTFGSMIFHQIQLYVSNQYLIYLPSPNLSIYALSTAGLIILIAVMKFVPALRKSLSLNPKTIQRRVDHSMPHQ